MCAYKVQEGENDDSTVDHNSKTTVTQSKFPGSLPFYKITQKKGKLVTFRRKTNLMKIQKGEGNNPKYQKQTF